MTSDDQKRRDRADVVLRGAPICPGVGIGHAHLVDFAVRAGEESIAPEQTEAEQKRYADAVDRARSHLGEHVAVAHGHCVPEAKAILDIHRAMLVDESFHDRVRQLIAGEHKTAERSARQVADNLISQFGAMRDPYLRARGEDIRDMAHNLIGTLSGTNDPLGPQARQGKVLVSRCLHSTDAFVAQRHQCCGFATESQALTSHAAILLKGFGIPAVGGIAELTATVSRNEDVIVDGTGGVVILNPSAHTLAKYEAREEAERARQPMAEASCLTGSGVMITLKANIESPSQIGLMLAQGLQGVGLFRTEYLISAAGRMPTEDEQCHAYRDVVARSAGRTVVIRTFDIGGDKQMGLSERCTGSNPSLGLRGIRRHLAERPDELRTQLRAVLRASVPGRVAILIPMVTTVDDVVAARDHLDVVKDSMRASGIAFSQDVPFGVMIETPAAAASVREILDMVSFVSVGTNDLLQYFMAADRDNERVARYNDASAPAFLWLMEHIIGEARHAGREQDVTICGEVSSHAQVLPQLLRMGYRSFSIPPVSAMQVRSICAASATRNEVVPVIEVSSACPQPNGREVLCQTSG